MSSPSLRIKALVFASLVTAGSAAAQEDCPPGSSSRSENGFTWCEPSVCANDGQCRPDEVCRPVALCMQVGKVETGGAALAKDGGAQRLVATQRCGPNKTCPDTTACSELGRCLARATADKMGLLAAPSGAAPATSAGSPSTPTKSCGCSTPGASAPFGRAGLGVLAVLGLVLAARARGRGTERADRR